MLASLLSSSEYQTVPLGLPAPGDAKCGQQQARRAVWKPKGRRLGDGEDWFTTAVLAGARLTWLEFELMHNFQ